jgi:hypothetical protein
VYSAESQPAFRTNMSPPSSGPMSMPNSMKQALSTGLVSRLTELRNVKRPHRSLLFQASKLEQIQETATSYTGEIPGERWKVVTHPLSLLDVFCPGYPSPLMTGRDSHIQQYSNNHRGLCNYLPSYLTLWFCNPTLKRRDYNYMRSRAGSTNIKS